MGRIVRASLLVSIILMQMSCFLLASGCKPEPEPTLPTSPTERQPSPSVSPPEVQPEVQGEIALLSSSAAAEYPSTLTFTAELESPADINKVELEYRVDQIATVSLISRITPDFVPAPRIKASAELELKKVGGLPPGAEITYRWKVEDAEGRSLETKPATIRFDDSRYSWTSLSENNVTLYWYKGSKTFAQKLMDTALTTLEKLDADTGAQLQRPVRIYIYASYDDLRDAMIHPHEWTGGVSYSQFGIVAIGISPNNLEWGKRSISHELAHLVTYQMTYNPYGDLPTWLNEGLSMYAEGDLSPHHKSVLKEAIGKDKLVSVRSLSSSFPAQGDPDLHYAESYSLVKFLIDTHGREKMLQLLHVFKNGESYDDALLEVYGFDTDGLEDAWRTSLGLKPLVQLDFFYPITTGSAVSL